MRIVQSGGKRCAVAHNDDDWFTSFSPRASGFMAEGPWDHWVDLAINILRDPFTRIVRPEAYEIATVLQSKDFYDGTGRDLTEEEIEARLYGDVK